MINVWSQGFNLVVAGHGPDPSWRAVGRAGWNFRSEFEDEAFEDELVVTGLDATTSAHDDWLHRGPFLFDMDFHTYMRFTVRKPRPRHLKVSDVDRA